MNKDELAKKKLQAQKKSLFNYRRAVTRVIERSERTLKSYPDSQIAIENKEDCEAALRAERKLYQRLQLKATQLPRGQVTIEDIE